LVGRANRFREEQLEAGAWHFFRRNYRFPRLRIFQQGEKLGTVNFPGGVEFSGVIGEVVLWLLVFMSVIWAFHILAA